jgi:hypothetical protein
MESHPRNRKNQKMINFCMMRINETQLIIQGKDKFGKCKEITRISKALTFGEIIAFKTTTLSAQGLLQSTSCADSNGLSSLFFYWYRTPSILTE